MSRANAKSWWKLVAGVIFGLVPPSLICTAQASDEVRQVAQLMGRSSSRAHAALSAALESQRRGEYEAAAAALQDAIARQDDLSQPEREELARLAKANLNALRARRDGGELVRGAQSALQAGKPGDAAELLKRAAVYDQYLAPADRTVYLQLVQRSGLGGPSAPGASTAVVATQARARVNQARAMLAQWRWEDAEALAREAEQSGANFGPREDSPRRVLEDLEHLRRDPKALLGAARSALARREYDRAEGLAHEAEKYAGFSFPWSDSPAKVLKEVQAARSQAPLPDASGRGPMMTADNRGGPAAQGQGERGLIGADRSLSGGAERARELLRQGRQALGQGDLGEARRLAEQAHGLRAALSWSEDTPYKLMADIGRAEGRAGGDRGPTTAGPAARSKEEAVTLVRQGRMQLAEGKIDEASRSAHRARALTTASWGLFEDSPDALVGDVEKARARRNKEESVRLLAEGRRMFEMADYDAAERSAYRAKTLHGSYSIWELGDRPDKLIADVQAARQKNPGRPQVHTTDVVQAPRNPDGPEVRARQMLLQARMALHQGDLARARALTDQARDLHAVLNKPGDDSVEAVYVAISQQASSQMARNTTPTPPAAPDMPGRASVASGAPVAPAPTSADRMAARRQAVYLMAQARELFRQDRLLEARQKVVEAQRYGATFQPDEETPELMYQQIAFRARQRVEMLVGAATDTVRFGQGDALTRKQKAEAELGQARQLAAGFGLDAKPIESTLAWVRQQDGTTPTAGPGAVARTMPAAAPSLDGAGKLDKARLELQHGQTGLARRMAEEVWESNAGMRDEAMTVIRSCDTEDFNQGILKANRTFDAAYQAYQRRDYVNAGHLVAAVDVKRLDAARQVRLREMMTTVEMQPANRGAIVQAAGTGPQRAPGLPAPVPPGAGHARATDDLDRSLLERTQAMRDILFQKLRSDGLAVMREANDKARSGQTDEAIEALRKYAIDLQDKQLDPGQLTLLRRPVEARIKSFELMKEQEAFANRHNVAAKNAFAIHAKGEMAEQTKQKNVAELMKQFNTLYKEGKYLEAEALAMRAHELDPDNGVVSAAIYMAKRQRNVDLHKRHKTGREDQNYEMLEDVESGVPADAVSKGIHVDPDSLANAKKRPGSTVMPPRKNEKEKEIERQLQTPVTLNFTDQPLRAVLDDLRAYKGLNIYVDEAALSEDGIGLDRPVSIKLDQVSLKSALNLLLKNLHLTYVINDEVLQITTKSHAVGRQRPAVYQVADLVLPVENFGTVGVPQTPWLPLVPVNQGVQGATQPPSQGAAPTAGPSGSSSAGGSPFASAQTQSGGGVTVTKKGPSQTNEEVLIKLIMGTVEPRSWSEMGGPGTIEYFPNTMALVINQTPDIQDQVQELLDSLRRLQDQEVAIEVRFITVSEDFFERIGVNFNMNIVNKSTTRFQPLITSGNFVPDPYINKFDPGRFIAGIQPNGAFTPTLDFPIPVNTFQQAIPPFGGYQGVPGFGGITAGLAFLSDIQVFLFMEAAQGDVRTNVMQAPKLTMFNGQTATLNVQDQQFFLTGVQVNNQQGIFTYTPQFVPLNQAAATGVSLTLQPVISADRRFVRVSLAPTLSNLATPIVELFPVVVPLFPLLDGSGTGQPIVFTQFIQQPRFTSVTVNTTVAVPDGGTVLMGGLKRLAEGRNEYGPPILSKIPYLNRLFKNVGYGRETDSLLLMVTPRIIIQAEEEERQTGYVAPPRILP